MSTKAERLEVIMAHKDHLIKATSFESFKAAQLAYLDWLIADISSDLGSIDRSISFIKWQEVKDV